MRLKLDGVKEYNGFQLRSSILLENSVIVLTGRNGSGKTRLLESMQNNSTSASIDDSLIDKKGIRLVQQGSLNPNFGSSYNHAQHQNKITATLRLYDQVKNDLDLPFDQQKVNQHKRRRIEEDGLDYESLLKLCLSISKKTGKSVSELSHDDIILNFEEPTRNILGTQNVSSIVNQYIKRVDQNELNEWRYKEKGVDVQFLDEQEFIERFGDKPWILINKILNDTFDGKFQFNLPDESSQSYAYQAKLLQGDSKSPVSIEHLSSGEKTLLWLALTLFNSQYYDYEIVRTPKILLVDEPDALLHPKMVLKMYQVFKSFNRNFNSIVIISTHSPTTVALAPTETVYLVEDNSIECIEKDRAIAELLDGVTQISLNPKNRRQVYVESQFDADVYQAVFSKIAHNSKLIDPKISLNFVSSGPKVPKQQIIDKAKQILGIMDEEILIEYAESLNGIGNCVQVAGQVEALVDNEHNSVRGIIDWDLKNKPSTGLSVLAKDYAYSIENVTLDPICILLQLHIDYSNIYSMLNICGSKTTWNDWLSNKELLQESVDRYIHNILGRENNKDAFLDYRSGIRLLTDKAYLTMKGHDLERIVKDKYPKLNSYCKKGKDGELKTSIVNKSMITLTDGKFIPMIYEQIFSEVQK